MKEKNKIKLKYHTVRTVPKCNRRNVEVETKKSITISIIHNYIYIYMHMHSPGLDSVLLTIPTDYIIAYPDGG